MGAILVYTLFGISLSLGIFRPHIALLAVYGFAVLVPTWNWRWSVPEDFGFQKYFVASCVVGLLFTGFRGNRLRGGAAWGAAGLAAYLGLSYLSGTASVSPTNSDWFLDQMWKIVLIAILGIIVLDSPGKIVAAVWVGIVAQVYNAYQINTDYFSNGYTLIASQGWAYLDNNAYTLATLPIVALALALVLSAPKVWQRGLAAAILVLQLHQIMLLESRGGMIGACALGCLAVAFMPKTRLNAVGVAAGAVLVAALAGPPVLAEFSSSFKSEGELDSSAESRYGLWEAGAKIVLDWPLLGVGPDAARRLVPSYYPGGLATSDKALHNLVFDIACGSGIPAAVCYFSFFGAGWWAVWRIRKSAFHETHWVQTVRIAVLSGIPGYLIGSMFSSGALLESSYLLPIIGLATSLVLRKSAEQPETEGGTDEESLGNPTAPESLMAATAHVQSGA